MKKRSLLFPASTFPRKPAASAATATSANNSVDSPKVKQSSGLTKSENKNKSSSNGARDAGATGGGGIPRPQLGITTSPSKLAVRTNTSKLVTTTNNNVHEKIVRSASGDSKDSSGPYKLLPPSISYSANNSNRTLVNDKLYPRIPNPGPPLYHPSGPQPQRSQTLSMIPSHSSRTKMGASQVRFGPPPPPGGHNNDPSRLGPSPHVLMTSGTSSTAPVKSIMKPVETSHTPVHFSIPSSAVAGPPSVGYHPPAPKTVPTVSSYGPSQGHQANMGPGHPNQLSHQGHIKTGPSVSYDQYKQPPPPASVPISGPGSRAMGPGPPHVTQRTQTPASFIGYMHPAQPTPPPYHQPPQPPSTSLNTSNSNTVGNSSTDSTEDFVNQAAKDELNKIVEKKDGGTRQSIETSVVGEYNKKVTELQNEVRSLKDLNVRLSEDNKELRDLCCFLDDDRQKGRKLAREWQRFGRYTASVMRQEVSNYQTKLKDLAGKQEELIRDNLELKELCLYLDEERSGSMSVCTECGGPMPPPHPPLHPPVRDEGDGSSSSTNNDESEVSGSNLVEELNAVQAREKLYLKGNKIGLNDEILAYIRNLEDRVKLLEAGSEYPLSKQFSLETQLTDKFTNSKEDPGSRPESVTNAMKVLEVHEQILEKSLDSDEISDDLGDRERALVREMCNVVWRKLEEN